MGVFADVFLTSALAERDARIASLERELDETLRELTETHRVNEDLEDQIFEEDGFINRIVLLEEENARLKEENETYAELVAGLSRLVVESV